MMDKVVERLARLESNVDHVEKTLGAFEVKMDAWGTPINVKQLEERLIKMEGVLVGIEASFKRTMLWVVLAAAATGVGSHDLGAYLVRLAFAK